MPSKHTTLFWRRGSQGQLDIDWPSDVCPKDIAAINSLLKEGPEDGCIDADIPCSDPKCTQHWSRYYATLLQLDAVQACLIEQGYTITVEGDPRYLMPLSEAQEILNRLLDDVYVNVNHDKLISMAYTLVKELQP